MMETKVCHGTIITAEEPKKLRVWENAYLTEEDGFITAISQQKPEMPENAVFLDFGKKLIIPAFSDLHVHAPQYPQRGIAMDLLLSDWLSEYTFPQEARFEDPDYAKLIYKAFTDDLIRNGTFHAAVYGTIHRQSDNILFDLMEKHGMYGYVGKVNMDCNSPDYLCESTEQSLTETERYLEEHADSHNVRPILTPRFAPTCTRELLSDLGRLAEKYRCCMQTHLVESRWEAQEALRLFPDCRSDAEIYERAGLLNGGTAIFGHVIFPTEEDIRLIKTYHSICVHCPDATTNVIAGIMPAGALLDSGLKIAIGSDIGAGQNVPVYRQISRTVQLSKLKEFYEPEHNRSISFPEAFYMATKAGGSLWDRVGSLEPGYRLNALVIGGMEEEGRELTPAEQLERFCYIGDDRNIEQGFIDGIRVK